jgi:hypothetical protein
LLAGRARIPIIHRSQGRAVVTNIGEDITAKIEFGNCSCTRRCIYSGDGANRQTKRNET